MKCSIIQKNTLRCKENPLNKIYGYYYDHKTLKKFHIVKTILNCLYSQRKLFEFKKYICILLWKIFFVPKPT